MDTLESTNKNDGSKKNQQEERKEGRVAHAIEEQTAKIPSDVFLWAAGAAVLGSLAFQLIGTDRGMFAPFRRHRAAPATFIGMWVPTLLLLGIYKKIMKVARSDKTSR